MKLRHYQYRLYTWLAQHSQLKRLCILILPSIGIILVWFGAIYIPLVYTTNNYINTIRKHCRAIAEMPAIENNIVLLSQDLTSYQTTVDNNPHNSIDALFEDFKKEGFEIIAMNQNTQQQEKEKKIYWSLKGSLVTCEQLIPTIINNFPLATINNIHAFYEKETALWNLKIDITVIS